MSFDPGYPFDQSCRPFGPKNNFTQTPPSPTYAGRKLASNLLSPAVGETEWATMSAVHNGGDPTTLYLTRRVPPSVEIKVGVEVAAGELAKKNTPEHGKNALRFATHAKAIAAGEPYIHPAFGCMRKWAQPPLPKFPKIPRKFNGIKPDHGELQAAPSCDANAQRMKRLNLPQHSSLTRQLREARAANAAREGTWDLRESTTPWVWSHRTLRGVRAPPDDAVDACEDTAKFTPARDVPMGASRGGMW